MFGEFGFIPPEERYQQEVKKEDERNEAIGKAIQSLEEPYATALRLRYFRRMTTQEIADEMAGPNSSVNYASSARAKVLRGLTMLEKNLDPTIFKYLSNVTKANHKSANYQETLNKLGTEKLKNKQNKQ